MYNLKDTIYALATVRGKAGVAVVRISGVKSLSVLKAVCHKESVEPRKVTNTYFYNNDEIIDKGLVIYFSSPKSFTGEDVLEFHVHSSLAVLKKIYEVLEKQSGLRLAEAGEFSRRAVLNDKMDLTEAEGLIDLINSETEFQRKIALKQYSGNQRKVFEGWRNDLVKALSFMEAYLDFPEEEVSSDITESIQFLINKLSTEISTMLANKNKGEAIRTGYKIAIIGRPNSGKSSLLNAITKRDIAIVSDIEGTTRDVIEAYLDIDGYPVTFLDTAGIRSSEDIIETEGVKRALKAADEADLILLLTSVDDVLNEEIDIDGSNIIKVITKSDLGQVESLGIRTTIKRIDGLDGLWEAISERIATDFNGLDETLLTRKRHEKALENCLNNLLRARNNYDLPLKAEDLRLAARDLGVITGAVGIEELLDVIFGDFCIGK